METRTNLCSLEASKVRESFKNLRRNVEKQLEFDFRRLGGPHFAPRILQAGRDFDLVVADEVLADTSGNEVQIRTELLKLMHLGEQVFLNWEYFAQVDVQVPHEVNILLF